ncbi:MAG: transglycosylase SLT domain-containing protein [Burkholderiaceae bacterium]|nr:transglycosylase SLT domain-containing protein [Burkholderiaceae bacterium]
MKFACALALAASIWLSGCVAITEAIIIAPSGDTTTISSSNSGGDGNAPDAAIASANAMPPVPMWEVNSAGVASLSAPVDLWDRIRRGFAMPDLDDELVLKQQTWYARQPDYIRRMTERSRMYLFHVVEELELRGMPTELALLPFVESAFNPNAVSKAKAAGIWQFMPATGKSFDLRQNAFRDDRRDVLNSTRAALDYLQKLYGMFGDWHLALAAYNWGEGSVSRAIAKNQQAGLKTGYSDLGMPAETRNYVPKLQAIKNIVADPQAFQTTLPDIGNHPFFDTVDITSDIDAEVAARLAEVRIEDFQALNPSHRKPVIFATGTPQVLLPWDNAALFKKNLAASDPAKLASWTAWVAPATLSISEAAKKVGMSVDQFRAVNDIPKGMRIKAGSTLLVPRAKNATTPVASHVVNNARVAYAPEVVLRRVTVRARKGDTVARLAARYDLPAQTVASWNKTRVSASFKTGQAVYLYLPKRATTSTARASIKKTVVKKPIPASPKKTAVAKKP